MIKWFIYLASNEDSNKAPQSLSYRHTQSLLQDSCVCNMYLKQMTLGISQMSQRTGYFDHHIQHNILMDNKLFIKRSKAEESLGINL